MSHKVLSVCGTELWTTKALRRRRILVFQSIHQRILLKHGFKKVFISQQVTTLGFWDISIDSSEPFSLNTKPHPGLTHFSKQEQLAKNKTVESKSKVSIFRDFPRTMDFDGLGLCSSFGRCCCLCAGFQGLNGYFHHGVSCAKVWGPVTLELSPSFYE